MAGAVTRPLPSWARLKLASTRACLTDPGRTFTPGSRRLFGCASVATGASARPLATAGHFIRKPSGPQASILEIFVSEIEPNRGSQTVYILNVVNLRLRKQVAVRVLPAATCSSLSPPGERARVRGEKERIPSPLTCSPLSPLGERARVRGEKEGTASL